jgi:predicted RNA methylase
MANLQTPLSDALPKAFAWSDFERPGIAAGAEERSLTLDSRSDSQFADQLWGLIQADHIIRLPYVGGEYYLDALDEVAYQFMVRDTLRNIAYRQVIQQRVGGKIVVEIGPGSRMFMTLMCVEAGARLVYAIEASETAYHKAQVLVVQAGVQEKVVLIPGWSTAVDIPELADVCLSELIGPIGNAEGASRSLNNAKRFLKSDGVMIPAGCLTWVSPVSKPPNGYDAPWLAELVHAMAGLVYEKVGSEFPFTRHVIYNFPQQNLIAPAQVFEEMWFDYPHTPEVCDTTLSFSVQEATVFDGLLIWIHLMVDRQMVIDALDKTNWAPVYVALESVAVRPGDVICVRCRSEQPAGRWTPVYIFEASVTRNTTIISHVINYPDGALAHDVARELPHNVP